MKRTLTTCPYCGVGCMFYLITDAQGQAVGVEPAAGHPVTQGRLCVKGWNAFAFVNHPDRLKTPLIRRSGSLEPASWDEALDLIVRRLRKIQRRHGNDAIAFFGSGKATNEENYLMMKLARAVFGTNNVDHCARLCHASTVIGLASVFGSGAMTNSISCVDQADCFFVIGSNTTEQHPLIGARILNAVQRGAKLIVGDNRTIRLARFADLHLRHKNGSDVALLNAMMHVILREGLENRPFIASRTENFAALQELAAKYPPEAAAAICGVPAEDIVRAARMFAAAKNSMILYSMGITQHTHGVDNVKSLGNLALLTGQIGRPGCGVNPLRGQNNVQGACDVGALPNVYSGYQRVDDPEVRKRFEAAWSVRRLPEKPGLCLTTAIDAAAEGRVKALYVMGDNPMVSDPDQAHVRAAIDHLDFLVVQDIFPTPTTALADVVLPAASYAEKDGTFTSTERRVQRVRKAIEPIGESRADWEILCEIARRAGHKGMNYDSPSDVMDEIAWLTPSYGGVSYARIARVGLQWPCPDAKHPGTAILHVGKFTRGLGLFSPAEYRPPAESPDGDYPFVLTTGRSYFHFHTGTMTRRSRLLDREERFPFVEIHPADARRLDVQDRRPVIVSTRRGQVEALARITDKIIPGVLFMTFHFEEASANVLTNNALDPEAKIPEYKVSAADIRKAP